MRAIIRTIAFVTGILVLLSLDGAFFPALGAPFEWMNISLIVSLYLVTVLRSDVAIQLWGTMCAVKVLTLSALFFIPLAAGLTVLLLLDRLIERFFTNRSYYVIVVLCLGGWALYHAIYLTLVKTHEFVSPDAIVPILSLKDLSEILLLLVPVAVIVSTAFLFTTTLSRRFRSYFIIADHT